MLMKMLMKMYENVNVRKRCPLGVYGPKDVKKCKFECECITFTFLKKKCCLLDVYDPQDVWKICL